MLLFELELIVMNEIWENEEASNAGIRASELVKRIKEKNGCARNTTYTTIKRCVDKGYVKRSEPDYMCTSLISRQETQKNEIKNLMNSVFGGSMDSFFSTVINTKKLSPEEKKIFHKMIDDME